MTVTTTRDLTGLANRALVTEVEVREIDEEKRTATFVAATESGVDTWFGPEVLRMGGLNLDRYRKNAVVLDSHDRSSAAKIIGRATVKVNKRRLVATITFAETALAEEIWTLVRTEFAKALSVGFIIREVKELVEGESDGRGENKVEGPATVITAWELCEVSVVPVGADQDAVRQRLLFDPTVEALFRRLFRASPPELKEAGMGTGDDTKDSVEEAQPETPAADAQPVTPGPEAVSDAERQARETAAVVAAIRAMTPKGLEAVAEQAILDGKTLDEAREAIKQARATAQAPAGTPETPEPPGPSDDAEREPRRLEDVDDAVLTRSLTHV